MADLTTDSTHTRRRTALLTLSIAALLTAALISTASPAGAATEEQTYTLAGTLAIGPPPDLTLPAGSTFTATYDTTTGAITNGHTSIPTFDRGPVQGPQANITITDAAPATGTLDPETGEAEVTVSFNVAIQVPLLASTCSLGPVTAVTSTENGSPLAGDPPTATVTAEGFTVPGVVAGPDCDQNAADTINEELELPTEDTAIELTVTLVPAEEPAAVVPAPVPVVPAFTG